ncbi:lysine--tRNA ligase [Pseudahrensia aquimaris]|uniref:Lysine--tRNA ligase n=1 Tax=Pseudahrensia aquimaris TaxID=744461 RepID=A0ABW3FKH9_9HYPH
MTNSAFTPLTITPELVENAHASKAWPFEEARKIVKRYARDGYPAEVIFETGYGPSGLPHIGTFGEVARTTMVLNAFRLLTEDKVKVRLICFSDDLDGMRKIPDNVPNQDMLKDHLGKPLSVVPDPFSNEYDSFAHHNNSRLQAFLDQFGFTYEFASATDYYKSGKFDAILKTAAERYDELMGAMLPTLGEERQASYSIFLPIHPETGRVLYVPMKAVDADAGTVTFDDEEGREFTIPLTGGNVKMQWKPDFSMRWAALGVDFEMYGKDHQNNSNLYDKICRIMGARAPEHFIYELFLDDKGEKISKSKGNGISMEQWLTYASPESLSLFMFAKPKTAKRLFFDVIPKQVDEYFQHLAAYESQDTKARLNNPVWHIHAGNPPKIDMPVSYSMLLNLVSASNASDKETLWGFISQYDADATPENNPKLDELVGYAIQYFQDFVKPAKSFRAPTDQERAAMADLAKRLAAMPDDADAEALQTETFSVGKEHGFENLREWFQALYQVLLGQDQGPRFGSFAALYGKAATIKMIDEALAAR